MKITFKLTSEVKLLLHYAQYEKGAFERCVAYAIEFCSAVFVWFSDLHECLFLIYSDVFMYIVGFALSPIRRVQNILRLNPA